MSSSQSRPLPAPSSEIAARLLESGLDLRIRLSGWSMKPLIPSGTVVSFRRDEPRLGDVVLARLPNEAMVAHRVIALDSERVWTKGDACRSPDGAFPRSWILARALSAERAISLPLSSAFLRALGLALNRIYPPLVALYRLLVPRVARGESASC